MKCLFGAMLDGGPLEEASRPTVRKATLPRAFGAYELLEEVARGRMSKLHKEIESELKTLLEPEKKRLHANMTQAINRMLDQLYPPSPSAQELT